MNYRWMVIAALFCGVLNGMGADRRPAKPNVILLLTDDLGWQDVKCYDIDEPSPMETPNIDALAKKGVMFWQAYSPAPTCSPSRCAIMSGNHPARAQTTHVSGGNPPAPLNKYGSRMMDPWYSARIPMDSFTLARAMKANGYVTGHSGKWHMAVAHHNGTPQPEDVGFDWTRHSRGAHSSMKDRLKDFATDDPKDPFHLDENGFPYHQNNEDALQFIRENKDNPFFLYYCTWLVHAPMVTRNEALLNKYVEKLGVDPRHTNKKDVPGQLNPFYCAMVESLDYYVGQVFQYLETTQDPRWPGHMLSENTYIIFTSDNGGMEGGPKERYTDNNPLDRGKISAKEGGTRVPLIVVGPGIAKDVQSDVMVNGLDFYPTILSLTGAETPKNKNLDGCDISTLLLKDPTNPALVKEADGSVRDTMMWHFPHGGALESTIRVGDYKLIRNYDHVNGHEPELELFRLYETKGSRQVRGDIEESMNLADKFPEKTEQLNQLLTKTLTEMNASYPGYNPDYKGELPNKESVPTVLSHRKTGDTVVFVYRENGAKVIRADLIYTLNGGQRYEEWFRTSAKVSGSKVIAKIPDGATHYILNLIDENSFLISYPEMAGTEGKYAERALSVKNRAAAPAPERKPDVQWTYRTVGETELKMDVFLPDGYESSRETYPTFVAFHGGSWRSGTPDMHYPDCAYWSSRGMVAATVDYRLKDRDNVEVPLECVKDAKSAIRFLRANAEKLKIDPDRVVSAGGSAGGQMAAATALIEGANAAGDTLSVSCVPNAVILYNPYWVTGCAPAMTPPNFVKAGAPPSITFLGDGDPIITVESLKAFHEALKAAGNDSEFYVGKGGKHGFCNGRNKRNPFFYWSLELTDQFLVKHGILTGPSEVKRPAGVAQAVAADINGPAAPVVEKSEKFLRLDSDKSGHIDQEEYMKTCLRIARRKDADGDGQLTLEEFKHEGAFRKADADQGGTLSGDEVEAMYQRNFSRLDENKDGVITPDEM